jgi:hypothetical protein
LLLSELRVKRLGFEEFDMRIVKATRDGPRSITFLIRVCGRWSTSYGYDQLGKRLDFLISAGLVSKVLVDKLRLNGEPKGSKYEYVATDRGCEALFYYRQFRTVYTSQVKPVEAWL